MIFNFGLMVSNKSGDYSKYVIWNIGYIQYRVAN